MNFTEAEARCVETHFISGTLMYKN